MKGVNKRYLRCQDDAGGKVADESTDSYRSLDDTLNVEGEAVHLGSML
jgi:hypothetical protein